MDSNTTRQILSTLIRAIGPPLSTGKERGYYDQIKADFSVLCKELNQAHAYIEKRRERLSQQFMTPECTNILEEIDEAEKRTGEILKTITTYILGMFSVTINETLRNKQNKTGQENIEAQLIEAYRQIGTPEELEELRKKAEQRDMTATLLSETNKTQKKDYRAELSALEARSSELAVKLKEYAAIGTPEQIRKAIASSAKEQQYIRTIQQQKTALERAQETYLKLEETLLKLRAYQTLGTLQQINSQLSQAQQQKAKLAEYQRIGTPQEITDIIDKSCKVIENQREQIELLSERAEELEKKLGRYVDLGSTMEIRRIKERSKTLQTLGDAKEDKKTQGTYEDLKKMLDQI